MNKDLLRALSLIQGLDQKCLIFLRFLIALNSIFIIILNIFQYIIYVILFLLNAKNENKNSLKL